MMKKSAVFIVDFLDSILCTAIGSALKNTGLFVNIEPISRRDFFEMDELRKDVCYILLEDKAPVDYDVIEGIRKKGFHEEVLYLAKSNIFFTDIKKFMQLGRIGMVNIFHSPVEELSRCIIEMKSKDYFLCGYFKNVFIDGTMQMNTTSIGRITEIEEKILMCSNKGYTINKTAAILNLSENTIAAYRSRLLKKLNVHSMIEALALLNYTSYATSSVQPG